MQKEHTNPYKKTIMVIGGFIGEETKGNAVEFFVDQTGAHTVVRSGGCQAGHNIKFKNGQEHMYRHFGAGTHLDARTHLHHMVINPIDLYSESQRLEELGIQAPLHKITVHEDSIIATPIHAAMSWIRELLRGKNKKGTIGKGVGEAVRDAAISDDLVIRAKDYLDEEKLTFKMNKIRETKLQEVRELLKDSEFAQDPEVLEQLSHLEDDELTVGIVQAMLGLPKLVQIVPETYLEKMILDENGVIVTETSHGVLLHPRYGFVPHVTQVDPTATDVLKTFEKLHYSGEIVRIVVTRCYMNRHGAGPLVTHDPEMTFSIPEEHNSASSDWLGEFRKGSYDVVGMRYSLNVLGGPKTVDGMMISFLDEMQSHTKWPVCEAYTFDGELPEDIHDFFEMNGDQITGIKLYPDDGTDIHYQHQLKLTQYLWKCKPVITYLYPTADKTLEQVFFDYVKEKLGVPVVATAHGPKASDRTILPEYSHLFEVNEGIDVPEFLPEGRAVNNKAEQNFEPLQTIRKGLEGPIYSVLVSLKRKKGIKVKERNVGEMIVKGLANPNIIEQTDAQSISHKWAYLKKIGVPVVTTHRINEDNDAILMTDVTHGGIFTIVDKHNELKPEQKIVNLDEVKTQILEIAMKAFDGGNGVFLSWESYALILNDEGIAKPLVLDLGGLSYRLQNSRAIGNNIYFSESEAIENATRFIETCLK